MSVSSAAAAVRKAFKSNPENSAIFGSQHSSSSNNNSNHSLPLVGHYHKISLPPPMDISNAPSAGFVLPTDINCWIVRGEPVLVLSIVAYQNDNYNNHIRDSFDMAHINSEYKNNTQINTSNIVIELETEINLKDLSGLLSSSLTRNEAGEEVCYNFIQSLLYTL
jgi:hypothetical protein